MRISFSTTGIFDWDCPLKYIKYISDVGFDDVMLDLSSFCSRYVLEAYGTDKIEYDVATAGEQFDRLLKACADHAICPGVMRTPHLGWNTKRTDLNGLLLRMGKDSLKRCEEIGCRNLIIQPLFSGIEKSDGWKENYPFYLELGREAKIRGIQILMENQCGSINGHLVRGVCADVVLASDWIDQLNSELGGEIFGYCLDTCAGKLCGQNMGEMVAALGPRLKAVLLRDCDGIHEAGRLPFTGHSEEGDSLEWISLITGLRKIEFDGILIMDARDTLRGFSHLLRPQIYPVIKSVCDFFQWQITMETRLKKYPSRVLFGAGAMCRHYMDYYGKKYPPSFICDNNAGLWGKNVCGLEIKAPENLKTLPENCVVVICNVFYKEISEQLYRMGIRHVETFNDEYLIPQNI